MVPRIILLFMVLSLIPLEGIPSSYYEESKKKEILNAFEKNTEEEEAAYFLMEHINSYDLSNIPSKDLIEHIRYFVKTKEVMPWGKKLPKDVLYNFVLFHRVAQEPFEPYRAKLFKELAPIVSNFHNIKDASLAVKRWLASKVYYASTSSWDIGPMSLLKRGIGRCEELSILYISALRSVAIPSRHVWIPAWRHADGNHGWIEIYGEDGKWHLIDSDPLDTNFDSPWFLPYIRQVPTVFTLSPDKSLCTKVYKGFEKETLCLETSRYAKVSRIRMESRLKSGEALVTFLIFNGGRLRPVLSKKILPGKPTEIELTPGGYVLEVKPNHSEAFMECINISGDQTLIIRDHKTNHFFKCFLPSPSPGNKEIQKGEEKAYPELQESLKKLILLWTKSEKDYPLNFFYGLGFLAFPFKIFFDSLSEEEKSLLSSLIPMLDPKALVVLEDFNIIREHLRHLQKVRQERAKEGLIYSDEIFLRYLINPQVSDYRPPFWNSKEVYESLGLSGKSLDSIKASIEALADEIRIANDSILFPDWNPLEILKNRLANSKESRLFALASSLRAFGIPSVFDEVERHVRFYNGKEWLTLKEEKPLFASRLKLSFFDGSGKCFEPSAFSYGVNFSITKLYDEPKGARVFVRKPSLIWLKDECGYLFELFEGSYELVWGYRAEKASYVERNLIKLAPGETKTLKVIIPKDIKKLLTF